MTIEQEYKLAAMNLDHANEFGTPLDVERAIKEANRLHALMMKGRKNFRRG